MSLTLPPSAASGRDPASFSGYDDGHPSRKGFFTDTSVCIGCKACEVACKTWNEVPEDGISLLGSSYDNTGALGSDTWRHVAFIEQRVPGAPAFDWPGASDGVEHLSGGAGGVAGADGRGTDGFRWLMSSDVCKHCTSAACLDVCPTGSLFRTEFGTVVVQQEICNGCGYCVPACPFGVIDQREGDGRVWKCTLCYDRLKVGQHPACAQACPTESIQFGDLDELRTRAAGRLATLHAAGVDQARLYLADEDNGVGGAGAFFLLLDDPEVYRLPPDPVTTTRDLGGAWKAAGLAAISMVAAVAASYVKGR
ncbi:MAG: 4Fe-4S dicluster domain-containing protein [Acidimicrobiales bacterium]